MRESLRKKKKMFKTNKCRLQISSCIAKKSDAITTKVMKDQKL